MKLVYFLSLICPGSLSHSPSWLSILIFLVIIISISVPYASVYLLCTEFLQRVTLPSLSPRLCELVEIEFTEDHTQFLRKMQLREDILEGKKSVRYLSSL